MVGSYLVAEWKHSVEAGENEADECIHTVQKLKADDIPCKKVPVCLVRLFNRLVDISDYLEEPLSIKPRNFRLTLVWIDFGWITVFVYNSTQHPLAF